MKIELSQIKRKLDIHFLVEKKYYKYGPIKKLYYVKYKRHQKTYSADIGDENYIKAAMLYDKKNRGIATDFVHDDTFLSKFNEKINEKNGITLRRKEEKDVEDVRLELQKYYRKKYQESYARKSICMDLMTRRSIFGKPLFFINEGKLEANIFFNNVDLITKCTSDFYRNYCYYHLIGGRMDYLLCLTPFHLLSPASAVYMTELINTCNKDCVIRIKGKKKENHKEEIDELIKKAFLTEIGNDTYLISPYILFHFQPKKKDYYIYFKEREKLFLEHTEKEHLNNTEYLLEQFLFHELYPNHKVRFIPESEPDPKTEGLFRAYNSGRETYQKYMNEVYKKEPNNELELWALFNRQEDEDEKLALVPFPKGKQPLYEDRIKIRDIAWHYQSLLIQYQQKDIPARDIMDELILYITPIYQKRNYQGDFTDNMLWEKEEELKKYVWYMELKRIMELKKNRNIQ